ncbi:hypothetical protein [Francisella sp. SYW-9]|nr:hypothetical protein [Francisella sp. SYW-9]
MKKINILLILTLILFSISIGDSLYLISSSYPHHALSKKGSVQMMLAM